MAAPSPDPLSLYRVMRLIRTAEEKLSDMLESKEVRCPVHLCIGQEAVAAGVCAALRQDDYLFGAHRSHGHYLAKGGDLKAMFAEILGKSTGCSGGRGGSMHLVAPEVGILGTVPIVSATIPIAVGAALASALRGDGRVSVSFFGDGAMEEGTFHESMNLAAHRKLPVLFACENNFYSSHLGLLERRVKDNLPDAATAHGMPGARVDGNDVDAVLQAARGGVDRARRGDGPTFLEFRTYRWRGHVGPSWDVDVGVQRKDELKDWLPKDPIARWRDALVRRGVAGADLDRADREAAEEVDAAVRFARESPAPDPADLPDHVFHAP